MRTLEFPPCKEHVLAEPPLHWTEGHIAGNGDIGAVVWGKPESLCIGLSKHDVNDLRHPLEHGTRWKWSYPEMVRRVLNGEREFLADANENGEYPGAYHYGQQQISCGQLTLDLLRTAPPAYYEQKLKFDTAQVKVEVNASAVAWSWGLDYKPVTVTTTVCATKNIVLVELSSESEQLIGWGYKRFPSNFFDNPEYSVQDICGKKIAAIHHALPCELSYSTALTSIGGVIDMSACQYGISGELKFGGKYGKATFAISLVSSFDVSSNPSSAAIDSISTLAENDIANLLDAHFKWWNEFWRKSTIFYDDKNFEELWTMALYAAGSSTRPDKSPLNLQGIWVQDELSPWHVDFHFNTNVQACHWMACGANHPELQSALVKKLTHDWLGEFMQYAKDNFDSGGLAIPLNADWLGRPVNALPLASEMSLTAWMAQHVWRQYVYTNDKKLLAEKVFPFLRRCAEFYIDILVKDANGQYNIELTSSPEQQAFDASGKTYNVFGRNAAIDISAIGELMSYVIKAADLLGLKRDELVAKCIEVKNNLPPLPVKPGENILIDMETIYAREGDRPGYFPWSHRHPSRLMAVFPAESIDLSSEPELFELAKNSFVEFHERYGDYGFCGWSWSYQANIAARLGLADYAEKCLSTLKNEFCMKGLLTSIRKVRPNNAYKKIEDKWAIQFESVVGEPIFQIEALLAGGAAVQEMLLQMTTDNTVIILFPAVPAGRRAAFANLRTPGPILVSAEYDGHNVTCATFRPELDCEIKVLNPWPVRDVLLTDSSDGSKVTLSGKYLQWHAVAGHEYLIS